MQDSDSFPRLLQCFFSDRLMTQRKVSPHTIASYRDTFRLLLQFAQKRLHKAPSQLGLKDLNASLIGAFLDDLRPSPQWRSQQESTPDGRAVFLSLCCTGSAGIRGDHPTSAGRPEPTTTSRLGCFSDSSGNRCLVGGAQSADVAGTA